MKTPPGPVQRRPHRPRSIGGRAPRPAAALRAGVAAPLLLGALFPLGSCSADDERPLDLVFQELEVPVDGWSAGPHVSSDGTSVVLSWLETRADPELRETTFVMDRWVDGGWTGRRVVATGTDLLVNWADFPSVSVSPDGTLAAHWLVRQEGGTGGYGIRVAASEDGGRTWSPPWTPHEDGTAAEHGFASLFPLVQGAASAGSVRGSGDRGGTENTGDGADGEAAFGIVWLDGRASAEPVAERSGAGVTASGRAASEEAASVEAASGEGEVALWYRPLSSAGPLGPEELLDDLTCECCQTDVAIAAEGPLVVYRNRTRDDVRDIFVMRRVGGSWEAPAPIHDDGWVFPACPVNGPAVAARDGTVAAAWFTAADGEPRVLLALSRDGGASFGDPLRIDAGNPAGRVDVALLSDRSVLVTWIERLERGAEVRIRRADADGGASEAVAVGETGAGQSGGFPRMAVGPDDQVFLAWTDSRGAESRVRVAKGAVVEDPDPVATGTTVEVADSTRPVVNEPIATSTVEP